MRPGFYLWVGKSSWRRDHLPTPVFWPGEFHGLSSPRGRKKSDMTEQLSLSLNSCPLEAQNASVFGNRAFAEVVSSGHFISLTSASSGLCAIAQGVFPCSVGSVVVARGLSCPEAGVISAPRPGAESEPLALEGRLLTTGPSAKSLVKGLEIILGLG